MNDSIPCGRGSSWSPAWRRSILAALLLVFGAAALGCLGAARAYAHGGPGLPPAPPTPPPPPKPGIPPMPPPPPGPPEPDLRPRPSPLAQPTPGLPSRGPVTPPPEAEPLPPRPGVERPAVTGRPGLSGGRRRAPTSSADDITSWQTWWLLSRPLWLPSREEARRRAALTGEDVPGSAGRAPAGTQDGSDAERAHQAAATAVPLLLVLAAPPTDDADVRASSLIALARLSTAPEALERVVAAARERGAPQLVRESAALALGLFRRSDARHQLPACDLERLREVALALFDDEQAPDRVRAFAAYALGLLGDQPFLVGAAHGPELWVRLLWARLARPRASAELPVALFSALGLQPPEALPTSVREQLRALVVGRRVLGLPWSARERSHALSALVRLAPEAAAQDLVRTLSRPSESAEVLRAAALGVGAGATAFPAAQRRALFEALARAQDTAGDPWTRGLARLAQGRLLGADLASGESVLGTGAAPGALLEAAQGPQGPERGYARLGLALAARATFHEGGGGAPWAQRARELLLEGLARESEDDPARAACAVALGLLGAEGAAPRLVDVVGDRTVGPVTRGHGAVALAQLQARGSESLRALVVALSDRADEALRAQAAFALGWLRTREALALLLRQAGDPEASEHVLAQAAVALGRLGDVQAVSTLVALAADPTRATQGRALAVVALGLVLDPEPRSSLARLTADANYPAATDALRELLTIL